MSDRSNVSDSTACVLAALVLALATWVSVATPVERVGALQVRAQARLALVELGGLSGLRDVRGRVAVARPLAVEIVQEGGPLWIQRGMSDSVAEDPAMELRASHHHLRLEVVERRPCWAIGVSLFRQGWSLRLPDVVRVQLTPWVAVVAAFFGAFALWRGVRVGGALFLTGIAAQALARLPGWPVPPGAPALAEAVWQGPLLAALRVVARGLPERTEGLAVGLLVLCTLLALFDHRHSRHRGGALLVQAALGWMGTVGWIEAGLRTGWIGFARQPEGVLALTCLAVAGLLCGARGRARPQAARAWARWGRAAALFGVFLGLGGSTGCRSSQGDEREIGPVEVAAPAAAPVVAAAPVAAVETSDAWLDLVAQRPSAVVLRDDAVSVDLGRPQARKHLTISVRGQWALAEVVDDRLAGIVLGRNASLDLPLDADLSPSLHPDTESGPALAVALELRALQPEQSVTVLWNERPLATLQLGGTWERRTVSLPREHLRLGENRLRLHFRRSGPWQQVDAAAAVARVEVGTLARVREPPPIDEPAYRAQTLEDGGARLRLAPGAALAYYFVPPRRSRLRLDVRGRGALRMRLSADEDHRAGRAPVILLEEALRPGGHATEIDLSAWGGEPVRVEIAVQRSSTTQVEAWIDNATVIARRTVPVDARARRPRDIVVLAIEGARGDAFTLGAQPPLPELEQLAEDALVFARAYALSPAALPSHAAWWTSVVPPMHLTVGGTFVADGQSTLPEAVARAGFFRALVTANADISPERGLHQGFDVAAALGDGVEDDSAVAVVRALLGESRSHGEHWLVFANVNDPQAPYEPPREVVRDVAFPEGAPMPHLTHLWVGRVRLGKTAPGERELDYVRHLYRGELRVVDRALGELLETLRTTGRLDEAIVVIVGVHGEEFFEHGGAGHGYTLYEESLRVPLMIRAPALLAPGRVEAPVDLLDLAPTLADLVGVRVPPQWQGESLVPVIDDPFPPPRLVIGYLGDGSRSALVGEHKYIVGPGQRERYFDLRTDPKETHELQDAGGVGLRVVRTALSWQVAHETAWRRARWGTGANLRPAFALDHGM